MLLTEAGFFGNCYKIGTVYCGVITGNCRFLSDTA